MFDRRGFLLGSAAVCAGCATLPPEGRSRQGEIRIAHCGDPQFGFSRCDDPQAYDEDLARFERTIAAVNALQPDLCFIAGDMTHRGEEVVRDWPRLQKLFKVPFVVTPGNHDMGPKIVRSNVERFRRVFGYDYQARKIGNWRFISGNSQYWYHTEERELKSAYEAWLERELAEAKAAGEKVILASHIPPYMVNLDEPDSYENCPKAERRRRFQLYVDHGVKFYLAGHTHRVVVRAWDGITILNAETTCRNFDRVPTGFRLFTAREDGSYSWDFHPVA